jgi:protein-disulfide isomerase
VEDVEGLQLEAGRIRHQVGTGSVAILEFADFQCPFCSKHAIDTLPRIKEQLIQSGRVRYVALHYPIEAIHPQALTAASAAECAGQQERFWEMHETLFANSRALARADLLRYAQELNLAQEDFDACLDRDDTRESIRADFAEGTRFGVTGTPSFFVGIVKTDGSIDLVKRINGSASFEVFAKEVDDVESSGPGTS